MQTPPERTDEEARALLDEELERLAPRREALGERGCHAVAGWTLLHAFEFEAAELAWRRAHELDADDVEALFSRGLCLLELGRWDDAAACFRGSIELHDRLAADPDAAGLDWLEDDPAYRLGNALHAKGDFAGALEAYEESVRRNTVGTEALVELARCAMAAGDPARAIDAVDRLERRPTSHLATRARAEAIRADAKRMLENAQG